MIAECLMLSGERPFEEHMTHLGIEKIRLQGSDEESVARSLNSLLELSDVAAQAKGLANVAVLFATQQPLRAIECLQIAYKLSPLSEDVLQAIEKVFELRGDRSAQSKFAELLGKEEGGSTKIKHLDEFQNESRGTRIVTGVGEAVVKRHSETRIDAQPYGVFREFVKATRLNIKFLEFAVEFSDDWVGLVQFISYLFVSGHIKPDEILEVGGKLHKMLKESCPNIKAHVRFSELIEPRLTQKS